MNKVIIHLSIDNNLQAVPKICAFEYEDESSRTGEAVAERAFHILNVDGDQLEGLESSIAERYRAKELHSLSVGDVVQVNEIFYRCDSFSWSIITFDELVQSAKDKRDKHDCPADEMDDSKEFGECTCESYDREVDKLEQQAAFAELEKSGALLYPFIIPMENSSTVNERGAANGYVGVSPDHRLHGVHYTDIPDDVGYFTVHGGITYSSKAGDMKGECPEMPSDYWVFGFDTNHYSDNPRDQDLAFVKSEARSLALQLHRVPAEPVSYAFYAMLQDELCSMLGELHDLEHIVDDILERSGVFDDDLSQTRMMLSARLVTAISEAMNDLFNGNPHGDPREHILKAFLC